ncbi:MAG TPA: hypothetical protein VMD05_01765 [Candidatus Nanoarchaeia archaeon]|nr:hypothetical protein [Candidatus Nanoarchaeia archaeon]
MNAERGIHIGVFFLLLIGLCTLSGWASYRYIGDLALKIAGIALSWGIILLALYVAFKKLKWNWWNSS